MQKTNNPPRISFGVATKQGKIKIPAYNIGNGLFLHRLVCKVKNHTCILARNAWTISISGGYSIADAEGKFSEVLEHCKILFNLDWTNIEQVPVEKRESYRELKNKFVRSLQ